MKGEHHCSAGKQQRSDDKHESEEAHAHTAGNTQDRQEEPEEDEHKYCYMTPRKEIEVLEQVKERKHCKYTCGNKEQHCKDEQNICTSESGKGNHNEQPCYDKCTHEQQGEQFRVSSNGSLQGTLCQIEESQAACAKEPNQAKNNSASEDSPGRHSTAKDKTDQ